MCVVRVGGCSLYSSAGMEPGQLVDHMFGGVCPYSDISAVGSNREDVGSPIEGTHCHPPTVVADRDVLYLQGREKEPYIIAPLSHRPSLCSHSFTQT